MDQFGPWTKFFFRRSAPAHVPRCLHVGGIFHCFLRTQICFSCSFDLFVVLIHCRENHKVMTHSFIARRCWQAQHLLSFDLFVSAFTSDPQNGRKMALSKISTHGHLGCVAAVLSFLPESHEGAGVSHMRFLQTKPQNGQSCTADEWRMHGRLTKRCWRTDHHLNRCKSQGMHNRSTPGRKHVQTLVCFPKRPHLLKSNKNCTRCDC